MKNAIYNYLLLLLLLVPFENQAQSEKKTYYEDIVKQRNEISLDSITNIINNCSDIKKYPELLLVKADVLFYRNQFDFSIVYYKKALPFIQDEFEIIDIYRMISVNYDALKEKDKSIHYLTKAIKLAKKNKDTLSICDINIELAYNYMLNNQFEKGENLFLETYENYSNREKSEINFSYLLYLLDAYEIEKEWDKFEALNKELITFDYKEMDALYRQYFYLSNANKELFKKNMLKAKQFNDSAFVLINKQKEASINEDIYRNYIDIYSENTQKRTIYQDSLDNLDEVQKYSHYKNSLLILEEKEELSLLNAKLKKDKINYNYLLIVFFISLVIAILIFKSKIKKRIKETEKISSHLHKLDSQNKINISQLEHVSKELKKTSISQDKQEIGALHRELNLFLQRIDNTSIKVDEHDFLKFTSKIENKIPNLNTKELEVLFFLKLGFTNIEISKFTNRTKKSIDSQKYRIRKKITTQINQELEDFLETISYI